MIGIAEIVVSIVDCMAGQGVAMSGGDMGACMREGEILMAALELEVCIYIVVVR